MEFNSKLVSRNAVGMSRKGKTTGKLARMTSVWERYGIDDIIVSESAVEASAFVSY